jgi:hypothetical protein
MSFSRWHRSLGIRPEEVRTVMLFFLHHFLLGVGTILVYVAANVMLLENHPETSLPIAYVVAALASMATGRIYAYFEHHWALRRLAGRVLICVGVITLITVALVIFGNSVVPAIAVMVGYRVIYLLTNLEFWGVSALVFDVRQSKRLFSVISSGDMPAKAMGAVLAVLVHNHAELAVLLVLATTAFAAAVFVLQRTLKSYSLHHPQRRRSRQKRKAVHVEQLFGGNHLIYGMCLSLIAVATVAVGIEYTFFIHVKHDLHDQADQMQFVGTVLGFTYLAATAVKLLLARPALERLGIRSLLNLLPLFTGIALLGYGLLQFAEAGLETMLIYFCGLYLVFEVLRRALFDPVFLVLFQPLTPQQRLQGHTFAKGFYEPLGMAIGGGLLLIFNYFPALASWAPFVWMSLATVAMGILLRQTVSYYRAELNETFSRRFAAGEPLVFTAEAERLITARLNSSRSEETVAAIYWLQLYQPHLLESHLPKLLRHPEVRVSREALLTAWRLHLTLDPGLLVPLAESHPDPDFRETAARMVCQPTESNAGLREWCLLHPDISLRKGAIRGVLECTPEDAGALAALESMLLHNETISRVAALGIIEELTLPSGADKVRNCLKSSDPPVVEAAIRAAGRLHKNDLLRLLAGQLTDRRYGRAVVQSLVTAGDAALPLLSGRVQTVTDSRLGVRLVSVFERIPGTGSRRMLLTLLRNPDRLIRGAAMKALEKRPPELEDAPVFQALLAGEWRLVQGLLQGAGKGAPADLIQCIQHELQGCLQTILSLLLQLYDPEAVANVRTGLAHSSREKRAAAIEILENLVPHSLYHGLQALTDDLPWGDRMRLVEGLAGKSSFSGPVQAFLLQEGRSSFSDWTLSVALRTLQPEAATTALILPYLKHPVQLLRESAAAAMQALPQYRLVLSAGKPAIPISQLHSIMDHSHSTGSIPHLERIMVLRSTRPFADTPEAILGSIVPIIREVSYPEGYEIFRKGDAGKCLYIIYTGQVDILDGHQHLAQFGPGDFFGELALLDTEPRSATAVAATPVLLLRIDQEDFYDLMEERPELLRNVMRLLCGRIRRQNEALREIPVGVTTHA